MKTANDPEKQQATSAAHEKLIRAQEQFDHDEFEEALGTLVWAFREDVNYRPLYQLAAACLAKLGGSEEGDLFAKALDNFNSFDSFHNLGVHFINAGHYSLAESFLAKALTLNPTDLDTAHDLAIAYARRFQIPKAVETLSNLKAAQYDFWSLYFLAKCSLLNKDTRRVPEYIESLERALNNTDNTEDIEIPRSKTEELKETLERYKTIENPVMHIRDWQFIQYGSIILDYFDSDEYVAGGRYVASWGSVEAISEVIQRLASLLGHLHVPVKNVYALPGRDSEIIARAISGELNASLAIYTPGETKGPGLVVAADASGFNDYPELSHIQQGQLLFALNQNWLETVYVNPDIIGFMTQTYSCPWNGGGFKIIDPESGDMERTEPDDRSPEEIASDILLREPKEQDTEALFSFYRERAGWIKGIGQLSNSRRYNFMIESPVPGSFFGS